MRVRVTIAEGHPRPYELPTAGEWRVDGGAWQRIDLPHIALLDSGTSHVIVLRVPGYLDSDPAMVRPVPGRAEDILVPLAPRGVPVVVLCDVPGATIHEGLREIGHPGEPVLLPPFCPHQLTVKAPRHRDAPLAIEPLDPAKPPPPYHVSPAPIPGELRVLARYPGSLRRDTRARISLDGELKAEARLPYVLTGLTQEVANVGLQLPGYKAVAPRTVTVVPGAVMDVEFDVEYLDAFLRFEVVPTNAVIMIGGWRATSNTVRVIPDLLYSIRVEAPGHRPASLTESARPEDTHIVYVELEPRTYFRFELVPADATVLMGPRRVTDRLVEVNPGQEYLIDIRAPHHESVTLCATAARGTTEVIRASLKRRRFE